MAKQKLDYQLVVVHPDYVPDLAQTGQAIEFAHQTFAHRTVELFNPRFGRVYPHRATGVPSRIGEIHRKEMQPLCAAEYSIVIGAVFGMCHLRACAALAKQNPRQKEIHLPADKIESMPAEPAVGLRSPEYFYDALLPKYAGGHTQVVALENGNVIAPKTADREPKVTVYMHRTWDEMMVLLSFLKRNAG